MWHHLHLLLLVRLHIKISIKIVAQFVFCRFSNIFDAVFSFYSFRVILKNRQIFLNWVWRYLNLFLLFIIHVKISNKLLVTLFLLYLLIFLRLRSVLTVFPPQRTSQNSHRCDSLRKLLLPKHLKIVTAPLNVCGNV